MHVFRVERTKSRASVAIKILLKWKMCEHRPLGHSTPSMRRRGHYTAPYTGTHSLNWMGRLCPYDLWFDTFEYGQKIDAWAFLKGAYGINHLVDVLQSPSTVRQIWDTHTASGASFQQATECSVMLLGIKNIRLHSRKFCFD